MKRLRIISIMLLALSSTVSPLAGQRRFMPPAHNLQPGKIVGTVLDKNDARIVGATIKIEGAQFNHATLSDEEGNFNVRLPAGVYKLSVEMDGFKRVLLAPFRVKGGGLESVSIHMEIKPPAGLLKVE